MQAFGGVFYYGYSCPPVLRIIVYYFPGKTLPLVFLYSVCSEIPVLVGSLDLNKRSFDFHFLSFLSFYFIFWDTVTILCFLLFFLLSCFNSYHLAFLICFALWLKHDTGGFIWDNWPFSTVTGSLPLGWLSEDQVISLNKAKASICSLFSLGTVSFMAG